MCCFLFSLGIIACVFSTPFFMMFSKIADSIRDKLELTPVSNNYFESSFMLCSNLINTNITNIGEANRCFTYTMNTILTYTNITANQVNYIDKFLNTMSRGVIEFVIYVGATMIFLYIIYPYYTSLFNNIHIRATSSAKCLYYFSISLAIAYMANSVACMIILVNIRSKVNNMLVNIPSDQNVRFFTDRDFWIIYDICGPDIECFKIHIYSWFIQTIPTYNDINVMMHTYLYKFCILIKYYGLTFSICWFCIIITAFTAMIKILNQMSEP